MLAAIFGVRPLFSERFSEGPWYERYTPSPAGEELALLVGMTGILALTIGVAASRTPINTSVTPRLQSRQEIARLSIGHVAIATMVATISYLGALMLLAGPGIFGQLRNGRSADLAMGGIPEFVMIIPLMASVSTALFLLTHRKRHLRFAEIIILLGATCTSIALVSQLGNRRFIIPAALIPLIAALIRKPTRVKLWHAIVALAGVLLLATIPMVRAAGARRTGEGLLSAAWRHLKDEGISGVIQPIFASYDTEMFDYIAIVAPTLNLSDYGWGRGTVMEFIFRPLPSSWMTEQAWSDKIMTRFFGGGCGDPVCPVASWPGVLYFEGGLFIVAIGSFLAGFLLRKVSIKWQYNRNFSVRTQLYVVIVASFALIAMRTNTVHAIWWILYTLIIAYVLYIAATLNLTRSYQRKSHRPMSLLQKQRVHVIEPSGSSN